MADAHFQPLKREPLPEEEPPSTNPTVRLIKGARIRFAPAQPTGLHRHPVSAVGFFEPAGHRILKFDNASAAEPAEIVCFYLADTQERPAIEMLSGGMDSQLGKT